MMFKSTALYRAVICIAITFCFLLNSSGRLELPLLTKLNHLTYDLRLNLFTPNTIDQRIVIVDIDEKSLAQEGRWPWSRDKLAFLIEMLFEYYQVAIAGFDVVFSEADESSGLKLLKKLQAGTLANNSEFNHVLSDIAPQLDFDTVFANTLNNYPTVLSYYFTKNNRVNPNSALPEPIAYTKDLPYMPLHTATGYGANLAALQKAAGVAGYFNNDAVDSDGSYRRLPLISEFNGGIYEALSLAMYRRLTKSPNIELGFGEGYDNGKRLEQLVLPHITIPVNSHAEVLVSYRGKQGSFEYVSATDVLNGIIEPERLSGKIILVGTTAAGLLDLRTTPVQNIYPGVEVHANLLSNMLDNEFKSVPSYIQGIEFLMLATIALVIILLYPKLTSIGSAIMLAGIVAIIVSTNFYLWHSLDIDSALASPLVLTLSLFFIQIFFGYFVETKKKNKLSRIFGQYIPAELVSEMSQSEHEYTLEGASKEMTVLFSDVRGFTSISEKRSPEELCQLINEILTPVTQVIHQHNGTIDKYIGDAVMAFWGAPLDDEHHAYHAVLASLTFKQIIDQINESFAKKGWPEINLGVGINTGKMNVGNMGSEFRMAYTVMGDAVNLASRLEGLTKEYSVSTIVSETTKQATPKIIYKELGRVLVKGKSQPITIFEPIAKAENVSDSQLSEIRDFETGLYAYYQQNWIEAIEQFEMLVQNYPKQNLYLTYLERTRERMSWPHDPDWNGTYEHKTK